MAGKRAATRDINHTNWDEEDEPEIAGTFQRAPEEVLRTRVIKKAKRNQPGTSSAETKDGSVFGNFTAFAKAPSANFSFLSSLEKKDEGKVNGTVMFDSPATKNNGAKKDDNEEYYGKLKGLNEAVARVIKKHVDENPFINLQPIFKDYEKYIDEIDKLKDETKSGEASTPKKDLNSTSEFSTFMFKPPPTQPAFSTSNNASHYKSETQKPQFSFGSSSQSFSLAPKTTGFTFSPKKPSSEPFTFTSVAAPPPAVSTEPEAENEDEPLKVEFTPVVEDGHVYTTRCKVFIKKDGSFGDRGVGNLYLKPIPDSEKVQLIVRADTNLGNLLCNFVLSSSIPIQRMGKKDVMLMCLPMPEMKPPPVPMLLRVKTPDEADELLKTLEKYKK